MPQPTMDKDVVLVIVMVSLFGAVILIMILSCIIRRCRSRNNKSNYSYDKVNHGLDEEEIEFKNILERRGLNFDTLDDDIFDDNLKEDLNFNEKDKDRLNMLEKLRSNLVSSAGFEKLGSDDEVSDNERIRI